MTKTMLMTMTMAMGKRCDAARVDVVVIVVDLRRRVRATAADGVSLAWTTSLSRSGCSAGQRGIVVVIVSFSIFVRHPSCDIRHRCERAGRDFFQDARSAIFALGYLVRDMWYGEITLRPLHGPLMVLLILGFHVGAVYD